MGSNTIYLRRLRSLERPREDDDALDPESDSLSEIESDDPELDESLSESESDALDALLSLRIWSAREPHEIAPTHAPPRSLPRLRPIFLALPLILRLLPLSLLPLLLPLL